MNPAPAQRALWTISVLTIPGREEYLRSLLHSLNEQEFYNQAVITVVYNKKVAAHEERSIEEEIKKASVALPVEVYFNQFDTSIVGGRNFQLNLCKTPLIVFVDDDITLHGRIFPTLLAYFRETPLGILGLPSYIGETENLFKPRTSTPHVDIDSMRYMPIQGMFVAGYRKLFVEIGGFNTRRRYWGEWTEMNLKLWRNGFPTAYIMNEGYLRHWEEAPDSPTRSLSGRERNVLWGLICTALEYDAVDINEATEVFWQLVEERYLAYSFGDNLTTKHLLKTVLSLMPEISSEWGNIVQYRTRAQAHPFRFMPFHNFSEEEVWQVYRYAEEHILPYREDILFSTTAPNAFVARFNRARQLLWNLWQSKK